MPLEVIGLVQAGAADLDDISILGADLGNSNPSNLTTYDFTVTVTNGTAFAALVCLITYEQSGGTAGATASCTLDPAGLNLPMRLMGGTANVYAVGADIYGMRLPSTVATGSYTVRVVMDTGHTSCTLSAVSLDNVASPVEPWDWNFAQGSSQSSEIVSGIDAPAGGILFFAGHHENNAASASFSTATETSDVSGEHRHTIGYDVLPNGRRTPQTETITWGNSGESGLSWLSMR